jgi:hypothetical protein
MNIKRFYSIHILLLVLILLLSIYSHITFNSYILYIFVLFQIFTILTKNSFKKNHHIFIKKYPKPLLKIYTAIGRFIIGSNTKGDFESEEIEKLGIIKSLYSATLTLLIAISFIIYNNISQNQVISYSDIIVLFFSSAFKIIPIFIILIIVAIIFAKIFFSLTS